MTPLLLTQSVFIDEIGNLLKQALTVSAQDFTNGHQLHELTLTLSVSRDEVQTYSK